MNHIPKVKGLVVCYLANKFVGCILETNAYSEAQVLVACSWYIDKPPQRVQRFMFPPGASPFNIVSKVFVL